MNAHQRRKASRAKVEPWDVPVFPDAVTAYAHAMMFGAALYRGPMNVEPWVMFVPADINKEWVHALKGDGTAKSVDFPLIRGEIGTIER